MTPLETVAATKQTVGKAGGAFMLHPATMARGEALGLQAFPFYYFGRCGVLGDADPDIVPTITVFFPPSLVAKSWRKGRALLSPADASEAYAEACREWGRSHLSAAEGLPRLCTLAERVVAAAEPTGIPLFAGWRALPLPDDDAGRASQLLNVLREHRGGLHALAVRACGLTPLEAVIANGGEDNARFFGWPEPYPVPDEEILERLERAELLTDDLAAVAYEALDAAQREELVELCAGVKAAAQAAR
jgi:hypothetical protein